MPSTHLKSENTDLDQLMSTQKIQVSFFISSICLSFIAWPGRSVAKAKNLLIFMLPYALPYQFQRNWPCSRLSMRSAEVARNSFLVWSVSQASAEVESSDFYSRNSQADAVQFPVELTCKEVDRRSDCCFSILIRRQIYRIVLIMLRILGHRFVV